MVTPEVDGILKVANPLYKSEHRHRIIFFENLSIVLNRCAALHNEGSSVTFPEYITGSLEK